MHRPSRLSLITAAVGFLALGVASAQTAVSGLVERVIDGDTIVVAGVGVVRLIGVDTPETVDPRKPVQYFGREATEVTKLLAERVTVRLEFEGPRKDKYDRTLAYVYLADGRLLNAELIRRGYAHAYTAFPFSKMEEFRTLEREARAESRGLWAPATTAAPAGATTQPPSETPATSATPTGANTAPETETVYLTMTGTKYHRDGCRFLAKSKIAVSLKLAAANHGPCAVCKPPVLGRVDTAATSTSSSTGTRTSPAPRSTPTPPGRCQATTKKGTQCSRTARPGSAYCWQHGG